jgi:esterase/lipase superfamily enzyme
MRQTRRLPIKHYRIECYRPPSAGAFALIGKSYILTAAAIALALGCCGCSARLPQGSLLPVAQAETEGTSRVPVLVATERKRSTADAAGEMFGRERAEEMSYASVTVSIPPDAARRIGEVQWPPSLPGDPRQSFAALSANYLDKPALVTALSASAQQSPSGKVLIFVHGFNNHFDEAVFRFAQIIHDSKVPALPLLFSWPSRGLVGLSAYQEDLQSATESRVALEQLFDLVGANANVKEVTILCHSMGCFLTLEALRSKAVRDGRVGDKVKNVLLVAPDVDVNLFDAEIRQMGRARPRFVLFVSQDDHALKLSKAIGGGITRLGDVDPDQEPYKSDFRRNGIMVFDLTHLRGDAHSRAFENATSVMGMIEERLAEGQQMTDDSSNPIAAIQ